MHDDVENYICDQNEVNPFRQFSFSEFHGEEDCDNSENMRDISTEPMSPIEQRPSLASGMWPLNIYDISQIAFCMRNKQLHT